MTVDGEELEQILAPVKPPRAPRTASKPTGADAIIKISPPKFEVLQLKLIGTSTYVQCRFSKKAQDEMEERMREGTRATSRRQKPPRDFDADFQEALHVAEDGWYGIPASAFRNAAIDVCRMAGFEMTRAKMSIFVENDGLDRVDQTPLVQIQGPDPEQFRMPVKNATGVADIRARPMWREWWCQITVRYDADQFRAADVINLFNRVGMQVGLGEGRPFSKRSNGLGFGLFEIENPDQWR